MKRIALICAGALLFAACAENKDIPFEPVVTALPRIPSGCSPMTDTRSLPCHTPLLMTLLLDGTALTSQLSPIGSSEGSRPLYGLS